MGAVGVTVCVCPDVLRTMPSKALELASYDIFKRLLSSLRKHDTDEPLLPRGLISTVSGAMAGGVPPPEGRLQLAFLSPVRARCCCTGLATSFPLYPLETARTRMTVDGEVSRNIINWTCSLQLQEGVTQLCPCRPTRRWSRRCAHWFVRRASQCCTRQAHCVCAVSLTACRNSEPQCPLICAAGLQHQHHWCPALHHHQACHSTPAGSAPQARTAGTEVSTDRLALYDSLKGWYRKACHSTPARSDACHRP